MILPTCSVTVTRPTPDHRDALGITHRGEPETDVVEGVLIDAVEGNEAQEDGTGRLRVTQSALMVHFPKTYHKSLAGCTVTIDAEGLPESWLGEWDVQGDPQPYDPRLCPGRWDRKALVTRPDL